MSTEIKPYDTPCIAKLKAVLIAEDVNLQSTRYSPNWWQHRAQQFYTCAPALQRLFITAMQVKHGRDNRSLVAALRAQGEQLGVWPVVHAPRQVGNPYRTMWYVKVYQLGEAGQIQELLGDFSVSALNPNGFDIDSWKD